LKKSRDEELLLQFTGTGTAGLYGANEVEFDELQSYLDEPLVGRTKESDIFK